MPGSESLLTCGLMRPEIKVILLSLLVFPGTGHFALRRWWRGLLFLLPMLAACAYLFHQILNSAMEVFDQMLEGTLGTEPEAVHQALLASLDQSQSLLMAAASYLILVCWIGSALDAARLARLSRTNSPTS